MADDDNYDDGAFVETICSLVVSAQQTKDPRIMEMMDAGIKQITDRDLVPTILLRYAALQKQEDELNREIERLEDSPRAKLIPRNT